MSYLLQQSERTLWWVLTDVDNGIVCQFKEGEFNETQKFTILNDIPRPDAGELAKLAAEMTDWLRDNHYEIIFTSPQLIKNEARVKVGKQLRDAREAKGWTTRHLAALTGIAFNHIARIEKGKYNVTIDNVAILANALEIEVKI